MVELLAAIVVFNLLIAGLVKLFVGQNSMVDGLEEWAEHEPVYYVVQDPDPIARALGVPARLSAEAAGPVAPRHGDSPYLVEILEVERDPGNDSATATFRQTEVEEDGEEDEEDEE
jgi:hypothetical protein